MKNSAKHIEILDWIRGLAILAVLVFHTLGHVYGYDELPWHGWFRNFSIPTSFLCLLPFASGGKAGVAMFFVVSGFCIHMSFHRQGQRWGAFFIRRFFRIYPAYLAALAFSIFVILTYSRLNFHGWEFWKELLTHLFLIHNLSPDTLIDFNGPFWSLAVEAQLYLLYPLLLYFVAKAGWNRSLLILAVCELLIRSMDAASQTLNFTDTWFGRVSWGFSYSPLGFWFSWAIGAYIADAFLKDLPLPFQKLPPRFMLFLAMGSYFIRPLYSFQFLCFSLFTASITSRLLARPATLRSSSMILPLLTNIGLWSYSIYLLHQPLLQIYSAAIYWAMPGELSYSLGFVLVILTWIAIIPFGMMWYRVFELPSIAFGKRVTGKYFSASQRGYPGARGGKGEISEEGRSSSRHSYGLHCGILLIVVSANLWVNAIVTPRDPSENNNRAWSLATNADPKERNGILAVKLAEDACQQTQFKETVMVGTLAAAYAESGQFEKAVATAQQACALAERAGDQKLLQKNQELLELYLKHQPYHEPRPAL